MRGSCSPESRASRRWLPTGILRRHATDPSRLGAAGARVEGGERGGDASARRIAQHVRAGDGLEERGHLRPAPAVRELDHVGVGQRDPLGVEPRVLRRQREAAAQDLTEPAQVAIGDDEVWSHRRTRIDIQVARARSVPQLKTARREIVALLRPALLLT